MYRTLIQLGRRVSLGSLFHSSPNCLEFLIVMDDNLVNLAFAFQNPFKYFIIPIKSKPLEPRSVGTFVASLYIVDHISIDYSQYVKKLSTLPYVPSASIVSSFIQRLNERIKMK